MAKLHSCWPRTADCVIYCISHKRDESNVRSNGTILYSLSPLNLRRVSSRLIYVYSVISVSVDLLSTNNKIITIDLAWPIRVRLLHFLGGTELTPVGHARLNPAGNARLSTRTASSCPKAHHITCIWTNLSMVRETKPTTASNCRPFWSRW